MGQLLVKPRTVPVTLLAPEVAGCRELGNARIPTSVYAANLYAAQDLTPVRTGALERQELRDEPAAVIWMQLVSGEGTVKGS